MYLQCHKFCNFIHILDKHHVLGYFRHVDSILIIHEKNTSNINFVLECYNDFNPNLLLSLEEEQKNINFLAIIITRNIGSLQFSIYRTPISINATTTANSCHPPEQK